MAEERRQADGFLPARGRKALLLVTASIYGLGALLDLIIWLGADGDRRWFHEGMIAALAFGWWCREVSRG